MLIKADYFPDSVIAMLERAGEVLSMSKNTQGISIRAGGHLEIGPQLSRKVMFFAIGVSFKLCLFQSGFLDIGPD